MVVIMKRIMTLLIKKARPTYHNQFYRLTQRLETKNRHTGHRFRCSIPAEVVVALLEVYEHLWHHLQQVWKILALPIVQDQS